MSAEKPIFNPILYLGVPNCFLGILLATNASYAWRALYMTGVTYTTYLSYNSSTRNYQADYIFGCIVMEQWVSSFQMLFLENPIEEWRHRNDKIHPREYPLWYRIYWCFCARSTLRGIGWSRSKLNAPIPSPSRAKFLVTRSARILGSLLWADLAQTFMSFYPDIYFSTSTQVFTDQKLWLQLLTLFGTASVAISGISMFYNIFAVSMVGTGLHSPMDWPDCFGSPLDAYSVARFWGKLWHQCLSRHVIGYGKAASKALGLEPRSTLSYVVLLLVGFFVSGLIHCGGDAMFGWREFGDSMFIFQIQALGILAEKAFANTVQRLGIRPGVVLTRAVGFAWVAAWFWLTARMFVVSCIKKGLADTFITPISVVGPLEARFHLLETIINYTK
ncbi:hypothetical protein CYLTODRAFT_348246 [Cylindrobasidium torrendii FP15055 ss-10]|uniref:Wax synthase domain-containing protein n=1 Tax=Cylindrobasidium torrendii FP15055 ss-10 TaxID=1314674 RepID=A0A0D7BJ23_9AGAR|nr:hypothetical protein CYLTODRAFT_348246 [Cylindrobasidium torrendii FP15055 ss-10]